MLCWPSRKSDQHTNARFFSPLVTSSTRRAADKKESGAGRHQAALLALRTERSNGGQTGTIARPRDGGAVVRLSATFPQGRSTTNRRFPYFSEFALPGFPRRWPS